VQRAYPGVGPPPLVGHPLAREPAHSVSVEAEAGRLLPHRRLRASEVGVRVEQHLQVGQRRQVLVAQAKTGESGKRAACAVARDRHRRRLLRELDGRRGDPEQDRDRVVDGRRPALLRREAVVNRKHRNAGSLRQPPACTVVRLQTAERPATPMQIDHKRRRLGKRAVQAHCQLTYLQVADRAHFRSTRAYPCPLRRLFPHPGDIKPAGRRRRLRHERSQLLVREHAGHATTLLPLVGRSP
jgi:hypothetical protein